MRWIRERMRGQGRLGVLPRARLTVMTPHSLLSQHTTRPNLPHEATCSKSSAVSGSWRGSQAASATSFHIPLTSNERYAASTESVA